MDKLLKKVITQSDEFNFGAEDITRLRQEFANLIDNLSDLYKLKEKEKRKDKLKATTQADTSSGESADMNEAKERQENKVGAEGTSSVTNEEKEGPSSNDSDGDTSETTGDKAILV